MDNWILKSSWITLVVSALYVSSQDLRSQNGNRRKLPTVIITREHLRQRPVHYGSPGDTAAEFIVSAGLDNSQTTATRIRKLGKKPEDSTQLRNPENTKTVSSNNGDSNRQYAPNYHPDLRYRTPNYNAVSSNQPVRSPQIFQRRQDVKERHPFSNRQPYNPDVLNNQQYIPPIFVPNYQQHAFSNPSFGRPVVAVRVKSDGSREKINIPSSGQDRRYFNPQESGITSGQNLNHKTITVVSPVLVRNVPEKQKPATNPEYKTQSNVKKQESDSSNKEDSNKDKDQQIAAKIRPNDDSKNVVVETPPLELNAKSNDIKNQLIRRPSIVLTDQITVNEVRPRTNRPRYGPRAFQHDGGEVTEKRRKREALNFENIEHNARDDVVSPESFDHFHGGNDQHMNNATPTDEEIIAKSVQSWKEFGTRKRRKGRNRKLQNSKQIQNPERTIDTTIKPNVRVDSQTPIQISTPESVKFDDSHQSFHDSLDGDVMSFSDFLSSPMAEKIRVERQFVFRNQSNNSTRVTQTRNLRQYNYETFLQNSTLLRDIIATRLLHSLLNIDNSSSNSTARNATDEQFTARSSPEKMSSAEQRHFGIVVSPYESHGSSHSKSSMPVIRVLRGKIVPLPELPRELIPLILGRYKHSYSSEPSFDDPTLTENMIDNAILSLLQNEEVSNVPPRYHQYKSRPLSQRVNKKSPSTNYVGSLRNSEPITKPGFTFKPAEWAVGPRCDRLTEEICLDDSDYPSSAIMSSIYKDKAKFDLMYAEVKVRESQVEGLSRQQEQAYTMEHYYGPYAQAASSTHEYGQNGGFVCPSEVHYGRPHRAKNRQGEWKVVVNVGEYTQTLRMEKCLNSGNPCKYVVSHMQSSCSQVFSYHRLLVFNKELGLHIDLFRVPSACTCHLRSIQGGYSAKYSNPIPFVQRPNPYEEFGGHVESAPPPQITADADNEDKRKNSFSSTLWSILGGGQQASALAQQPQFLDEVQKQIGWTQQLKQFPQFMKQISPNQVLKQLLEDDEEEQGVRRYRVRASSPDVMSNSDFASHLVPIAVPLPPPPKIIPRRPVVSASPPQHVFGMPSDVRQKVIAVTQSPAEKSVFSLTQEPGKSVIRISPGEQTQQQMVGVGSSPYEITAYKIYPGMYSPTSGEDSQVPEDSFVPIAPRFSENVSSGDGTRAVLKPMPRPKGTDRIIDEEDLIAVEKSEDGEVHTFKLKTVENDENNESAVEVDGSKINFSYHPILEYLNFS